MDSTQKQISRALKLPSPVSRKGLLEYESIPILGLRECYISKDDHGNLVFAICLDETKPSSDLPQMSLEYLDISPSTACFVSSEGQVHRKLIFRVTVKSSDFVLLGLFLRVFTAVLTDVPCPRSQLEVQAQVSQLVELFRSLEKPPKKALHGLWGELFILTQAPSAEEAVSAWHNDPFDIFDFHKLNEVVEVKCTLKDTRRHRFSLEQVNFRKGIEAGWVASVMTEEVERGVSVMDLAEEIRANLRSSKAEFKFDGLLFSTLGASWHTAGDVKFNKEKAIRTLKFYDLTTIPSIGADLPAGVSRVRFDSSLELSSPLTIDSTSRKSLLRLFLKS